MLLKRMTALSEFLRKRVKSESGVTMIETLVVILMVANLMAIALPSFIGHTDKFYDKQTEMAVVTAAEALAYINREGALPNEAALVSKLEEEEPAYTYHSYQEAEDGSGIPASGPENLSVSRENDDQGSVCGLSNSGKVYCARVNRTGLLIIADSNPSDNPLGAIVANANPLAFLNPESAAAVSQKEREDRKMSICSGDNETEVRGCLADSILDALEIDPEDPPPGEDPLGPVTDPDPDPGTEPEEEEEEPTPPGGSDQFVLSTGENIVGVSFLQLDNNSQIIGGAGTNGQARILDSARVCGPLRYGPGTPSPVGNVAWDPTNQYTNGTGGGVCPGNAITQSNLYYPDVAISDATRNTNSNSRLVNEDPVCCNIWQRGNYNWNPSTRVLTLNYGEIHLTGTEPYLLCQLVIQGGGTVRTMNPAGPTRIFFDDPGNCPTNPMNPLVITSGAKLENNGHVPGFFFVGSTTQNDSITFNGGGNVLSLVMYAPQTNVNTSSGFRFNGALIANRLTVTGGSNLNATFDGSSYGIPVVRTQP